MMGKDALRRQGSSDMGSCCTMKSQPSGRDCIDGPFPLGSLLPMLAITLFPTTFVLLQLEQPFGCVGDYGLFTTPHLSGAMRSMTLRNVIWCISDCDVLIGTLIGR